MVASSQTLATQVGVDILKKGGSAVDAAIATNAMLSLTEPHMCGPGGDLFALVWDPRENELIGLNASGRSPLGLTYEALREAVGSAAIVPGRGPLSLSTPGAVDGWCALHQRFGRLPFAQVLRPAIDFAREGISVGSRTAEAWAQAARGVVDDPNVAAFSKPFSTAFMPGGKAPCAGQTFHNLDLAVTYEAIAQGGRNAFYGGPLAEKIIAFQREASGHLTTEDLLVSHYDWIEPITTSYRGYDVFELPPNGQGLSVLQMLNLLESYPLSEWGADNVDYWHAFIEAKKLAFEDRAHYYADPEFATIPVAELNAKSYADSRRALIDPKSAGTEYSYGDVAIASGDTTYLSAADGDGMMVSLIQSIFAPFGSGIVAPGTGFCLQCRGAGFSLEAGHPNVYAPRKRPFHTIIPAFVLKDGAPWMSFGVMGADMQPQGQVQVLVNMIDFEMDPQAAGDAARMRHFGGAQPNGERYDKLGVVQYEPGFAPELIEALRERGHNMQQIDDWITGFVGGYQAIQRDEERKVYTAGSEPRLDGCALGY